MSAVAYFTNTHLFLEPNHGDLTEGLGSTLDELLR
jgi:hypothetical protein